ncbi:MAG: hypothetical protein E7406_01645 [Ruminococcaceae bacterium]|nr:hypothetical protein [Oscillospiraceae bacterium]
MKSCLLRSKIVAKGMKIDQFCRETGIKKTSLYRKLSGKTQFTRGEIERIIIELELTSEEIMDIFFE